MSFRSGRAAPARREPGKSKMNSGTAVAAVEAACAGVARALVEPLETRAMLAASLAPSGIAIPDHVVIVIEQDRAADVLGTPVMPYLNGLAATGLVYTNSHGVAHPTQPNLHALYSGSTQGITTNDQGYSFPDAPNLAKSLFDKGVSFSGFVEDLPADGSQANWSFTGTHPDLYTRYSNPMAQYGNIGLLPDGSPRLNAAVNRTFGAFTSIPTHDYSSLPTVSFVIPNNLNSTHGSNTAEPWAGSPDEENNDILRARADRWLSQNLNSYFEWAKENNSLLIVTGDEERWAGGNSQTVTTVVNGDRDLFVPGADPTRVDHYSLLRTIEDMYDLPLLGSSATAARFNTDGAGRLASPVAGPLASSISVVSAGPTVFKQPATFVATVSGNGSGTPTGLVTFTAGGTTLGTAVLHGGVARFTTNPNNPVQHLAVGTHAISATYTGAGGFASSASVPASHVVNRAQSSARVVSSAPVSGFGQPVQFAAILEPVAPAGGVPSGAVQFVIDGVNFGAPVRLVDGEATSPVTSALTAGSHTVAVVYEGFGSFLGTTSPAIVQTVTPAVSSTALAVSPASAVTGQSVTLTATVTANGPVEATGTVTFRDGSTVLGTAPLGPSGVVSLQTSALAVGTHSLTATFDGDTNYAPSTSAAQPATVARAATATAVSSSASPTVFGEPVTLTATVAVVAPGAGQPTGTVTFAVGSTVLGTAAVGSDGRATLTTSALGVGARAITAAYLGDNRFAGSTSAPLDQVVNPTATTTSLASSANPAASGLPVTFTATVAVTAPGAGLVTGAVQFVIDGANFGRPVPLVDGTATSPATAALPAGAHTVTAAYVGSPTHAPSTSAPLTQSVAAAATVTSVSSSANPSGRNEPVTFSATVSAVPFGAGPVTGMVQFVVDGANFGIPVALVNGSAVSGVNTSLATGTHAVRAVYLGSADFATSTSATLNQVVVPSSTGTVLRSSANPSVSGQAVSFTATVSAHAVFAGTVNGQVQFVVDGVNFGGPVTLVDGSATSPSTATLAPGAHQVTANYLGSSAYAPSTSLPMNQVVDAAATTTTLASSANPSVFGQLLTLTATVAPVAPGAGTPAGFVRFKSGATVLGDAPLDAAGRATLANVGPPAGQHPITAAYAGEARYAPSTSAVLSQVVNPAATTTSIVSSVNPSTYGQVVRFTATVAAAPAGPFVVPGAVQFLIDGVAFGGPVALVAGTAAVLAPIDLPAGPHAVTAAYTGGANFAPSTSPILSQSVARAATTTVVTAPATADAGRSISFSAAVTSAAPGAMTGTVQFTIDGADFGAPVALVDGTATSTAISALAAGDHTIAAVYSGDTNFAASSGSSATRIVAVVDRSTSTALTSSAAPSVHGQIVTLTAAVTSPGGTPGGTVTFFDGGATIGTATLNAAGVATLASSALGVGTHSLTAVYAGAGGFTPSTSPALTQVVNRAATTTTITSTRNPAEVNQPFTVTLVVAPVAPGAGVPTGTVEFRVNGENIGSPVALDADGSVVSPPISLSSPASYTVTAVYSGDASFAGSTSAPFTQVITPAPGLANDAFAARSTLVGESATATGTNVGATRENGEPKHAGSTASKSVWWTWTAPRDGAVTIDTFGSRFDTVLAVYTGTSVSGVRAVPGGSNDDSGGDQSKVRFNATAGTTYQIAVDGYRGRTGDITLHLNLAAPPPAAPAGVSATDRAFSDRVRVTWDAVAGATGYEIWRSNSNSSSKASRVATTTGATTYDDFAGVNKKTVWYFVKAKNAGGAGAFSAGNSGVRAATPPNDRFADRAVLTGTSLLVEGSNASGRRESGEPNHAGNRGGKSVWWSWTAASSGTVTIDTLGSDFDTLLAAYTGSGLSTLRAVTGGSNNDSPAGGTKTSKVMFAVTAGTTYHIAVDGYSGASGAIVLRLNLTA